MDINYNQHDLADYRGKVVLIEFMRTDCPVCQSFPGIIEKIRTRFGSKVAVLSIVNAPPDNQATVQNFITALGAKNPILFDSGQVAASYFRITPSNPRFTLPYLFLIDAKGQIRADFEYKPDTTSEYFTGDGAPLIKEIEKLTSEIESAAHRR